MRFTNLEKLYQLSVPKLIIAVTLEKRENLKLGKFGSRGGMVGNKDPKRNRNNEDGSQPSSGPESRCGWGAYT